MVEVLLVGGAFVCVGLPAMCARPFLKYYYITPYDTKQTLQQVSPEIKHLREALAKAEGKSLPITEHMKSVDYWKTFQNEFYSQ